MLKFAVGLIFLLIGSVATAVFHRIRYGTPIIRPDGGPRSLREFVERKRADRYLPVIVTQDLPLL
jgi:hypothetical protein